MALDLQSLQARDFFDRARKFVHRRSYWQSLAKSYPVNGISLSQLDERLALHQGMETEHSQFVPLPGLTFRRGRVCYKGHLLESVPPTLVSDSKALRKGEAIGDASALIAAGLAFQTATTHKHSDWNLVLSPHEDDASVSLGGYIHQTCASSARVLVCNAFTVCSWLGDGFRQSFIPAVTTMRAAEEELCNRVLGSASVELGLWDAQVRNYHRRSVDNYPFRDGFVFADDPDLRTPGEHDTLKRSTMHIIEKLRPSRVFFPLGLGSHLDHRFLRDAGVALRLAIPTKYKDCAIYFYEDQPYATYDDADVAGVAATLLGDGAFTPEYVDVTTSFEAKIQAVSAHRSQFRRDENEGRLRGYANALAKQAGLAEGRLAERIWRLEIR